MDYIDNIYIDGAQEYMHGLQMHLMELLAELIIPKHTVTNSATTAHPETTP